MTTFYREGYFFISFLKKPIFSFEKYIKLGDFPLIALENFERKSAYQIVNDIYYSIDIRKNNQCFFG